MFKEKVEKVEKCMQKINNKYGTEIIKNATLIKKNKLPHARRKIDYDNKK